MANIKVKMGACFAIPPKSLILLIPVSSCIKPTSKNKAPVAIACAIISYKAPLIPYSLSEKIPAAMKLKCDAEEYANILFMSSCISAAIPK